jgi:hypothetical protein
MKKIWIPALVATAVFSANAFAHGDWDDDDHCERRYRHRVQHVVVQRVYDEPQVIYEAPPVVYRERIVYRERPVYYEAEPRYEEERPTAYRSYKTNRVIGQAVGAVAGGLIGHQVSRGNGRIAETALGAVVGSVVGASMLDDGY